MFSTCCNKFGKPARRASKFSCARSALGTPPLYLSARTVATTTTASGAMPHSRHLMSKNFCAPKSAPKPASVTAMSDKAMAARVAIIELHPCAMFAKGPPCTNTGVPSSVCTKLGLHASFKRAAIAPSACKSCAVMGSSSYVYPTTILPKRSFKSVMLVARQNIAITSDATVISKPSSRGTPFALPPKPQTMWRSCLSFMSTTRFQVIRRGSMFRAFPW